MQRQAPRALTEQDQAEIWAALRRGGTISRVARSVGRHPGTVHDFLARTGGVRPAPRRRAERRLTLAEREELSRGLAAGLSFRAIASGLGRTPSTVSREVARNGGRRKYRAAAADKAAWQRAVRPKPSKLQLRPALRDKVEQGLRLQWSPEQIAGWLRDEFP